MELPAVDHLGYAVDLSIMTPFDINSVDSYVIRSRRLLSIDTNNTRDVVVDGVTYTVPAAVLVDDQYRYTRQNTAVFPSGREAIEAFKSDTDYAYDFMAVHGPTSALLAADKSFLRDQQYRFFSWTYEKYKAVLQDYANLLDETALTRGLQGLPLPFDSSKTDVVEKYETFFREYGTHIIINAVYGGRYPLEVWVPNYDAAVNDNFFTDVHVMFNGIPASGYINEAVKEQDQYKLFSRLFQYLLTISGGRPSPNLPSPAGTYQEYRDWMGTVTSSNSYNALCSLEVTEIWTLMNASNNSTLRSYADSVYSAFTYLVGHPDVYKTHVTFNVQAFWGEFDLLTPSAVIIPDPENPFPTQDTIASGTRVRWDKGSPYNYESITLRFYIVNDGSPIDFSLSHASNAGPSSLGKVTASLAGHDYLNSSLTDRFDNTLFYYKVPVNSEPESRQMEKSRDVSYTWDEVLRHYLDELREEGHL